MSISVRDLATLKYIDSFFKAKGVTVNGRAGLLGNMYAESGIRTNNLQNSCEKKWNCTDESYTSNVDAGTWIDPINGRTFIFDGAGYGLCQWTTSGRKSGLYNTKIKFGKSISDPEVQCTWLYEELTTKYKSVWKVLTDENATIKDCAGKVVVNFEVPASVLKDEETKQKTINTRTKYATEIYETYLKGNDKMFREKVINVANGFVGTFESPAHSNKVIFNQHYYGSNKSAAWCCAFVWDCFRLAGCSESFYNGKKTASCTTLMNDFKSRGLLHNDISKVKPGDIVFFQTKKNSVKAQHVGIVINSDGKTYINSIEGNTSSNDELSQDNGGEVALKRRTFTGKKMWIYKFASVRYSDEEFNPYNIPSSTVKKGDKGESVKWVQYQLVKGGYSLDIDGSFGGGTEKVVIKFQKDHALEPDGKCGKNTRTELAKL